MKAFGYLAALVVGVFVALAIWAHFRPSASSVAVQREYDAAQDTILGARLALRASQDSLRVTRAAVNIAQVERDAFARKAAEATVSADSIRKALPPPPAIVDSTNPAWEQRAILLQDENTELRVALTQKDSVINSDSVEKAVYARQIRSDSVTKAYADGALAEAKAAVGIAQRQGKLLGIIPLPSRLQSYVLGGLTVLGVREALKHAGP